MPRVTHGHEAYSLGRTYWGKKEGLSILEVLKPMLDEHVRAGRVTLKLGSDVDGLIIEDGIVCVLKAAGESFRGRNIVLSTGGYGANPDLFARLHRGATLWPGSSHHATGRGLELGLGAGGSIGHDEKFLPNFGGVLDHTLGAPDAPRYRAPGGLVPQDRQPWELIVNLNGERF